MGEQQQDESPGEFRFLSDAEFATLSTRDKALYVVRAQQELEERKKAIQSQMFALIKEQRKSGG